MNTNATSLDRLHDLVVPAAVPWWPPAPGWYWLLAFVLLVSLTLLIRGVICWQHNRYRREALSELTHLKARLRIPAERATALLALSGLLKRTALTAFPREQVATLTGIPWFEFLDRTGRGTAFSEGLGARLENAIFDPRTVVALDEPKLEELTAVIRHWIKHHSPDIRQRSAGEATTRPADPSLPLVSSVQKRSA